MKIALVAPSDHSCGEVAEQLASHASVDLLTTCRRDDGSPRDFFSPGREQVGSFCRHRFRSDYASVPALAGRLAAVVSDGESAPALEARWMQERGPYSSALLDHLAEQATSYDVFVFFGLEAATTVFGLACVGAPSVVVPQLRDLEILQSRLLRAVIAGAAGFVFGSEDESRAVREHCRTDVPHATGGALSGASVLEVIERVTAVTS